MSTYEFVTVVRLPLPELDNKNNEEVLAYFAEHIGEPEDHDVGCGYIYHGDIEDRIGKYRPVHGYETGRWCVDLILHHERDAQETILTISAATLAKFEKQMQEEFEASAGAFFTSYCWYTGVDEDICTEPDHNIGI
jgi:hypothetical protein